MKASCMQFFYIAFLILAFSGCKRIMIARLEIGREFPGTNERTLKKISQETGVPVTNIVLPDKQAWREMNLQLSRNEIAFPFVYLLNDKKEQLMMPDTLSKNQCIGLVQKYLLGGISGQAIGEPKQGNFYSVSDSSVVSFIPGKHYVVLAYVYEMGKVNNGFYRSIQKLADNPGKNLQLFLVILNRG